VPECSAGPVSGPPDLQGDKLNINSDLTGHLETFLLRMYVYARNYIKDGENCRWEFESGRHSEPWR
jgi:hypothetical protein